MLIIIMRLKILKKIRRKEFQLRLTVIGAWINIILYNIVYVDVFMPFNFDFIFCVRYTLCFNSVLYTMLYLRAARGEQVIKFR